MFIGTMLLILSQSQTMLQTFIYWYFRYPDALGVADVYSALNSQPITDFLTNKFLGVEENNGLSKVERWLV